MLQPDTIFAGRHHETGSVCNALAVQGFRAPHTGQPYSEALLMGLSGGAVFGYFQFDYKGHAPMLNLISRNTFDPLETLLNRLGGPHAVTHSGDAAKAERMLIEAVQSNQPVIVRADMCTLPYNRISYQEQWWAMLPVLVYGSDETHVYLADRSNVPLRVERAEFSQARARVKKTRFEAIRIGEPDVRRLKENTRAALLQCIALYAQTPPKGAANNFGFAAYAHWAEMLVNTRNAKSWARYYPAGRGHWSAVAGSAMTPGLFGWIATYSVRGGFERGLYADFLDEAALLLNAPKLNNAAGHFRRAEAAWRKLAHTALPDEPAICKETRMLIVRRHAAFEARGAEAGEEIDAINARLAAIRVEMETAEGAAAHGLDEARVVGLRAAMREHVLAIAAIEREAVDVMTGV
jgi:hypothetical protein